MLASVVHADGSAVGAEVEINHGHDGWVLIEMDWSPESGVAVYDYVQYVDGKFVASACALIPQPHHEKHVDWKLAWNHPQPVFTLR